MSELTGIFKRKYPDLSGVDWIKRIEPEDRHLLIDVGMKSMEWGRMGGRARSSKARRNERGRFVRDDGTCKPPAVQETTPEIPF